MIKIMPSEKNFKDKTIQSGSKKCFIVCFGFVYCIELVQSLVLKGLIASSHPGRSQPL